MWSVYISGTGAVATQDLNARVWTVLSMQLLQKLWRVNKVSFWGLQTVARVRRAARAEQILADPMIERSFTVVCRLHIHTAPRTKKNLKYWKNLSNHTTSVAHDHLGERFTSFSFLQHWKVPLMLHEEKSFFIALWLFMTSLFLYGCFTLNSIVRLHRFNLLFLITPLMWLSITTTYRKYEVKASVKRLQVEKHN